MSTAARLDWKAIRPLNGSRAGGFEELCAQLARHERPAGSYFERKGTPDAGVECYAILADKSEWGWQAKYVDVLGDTQWSEIDGSVKTALEKHPNLVRYFVCVPYDRPDARQGKKKSAKERWNDHVGKWERWAADRNMTVAFEYWGSSELLELLRKPEHAGRTRFWFSVAVFEPDWFAKRLEDALVTAGARYTPAVHVDLPIAATFDALGRTPAYFARVKSLARGIRRRSQSLRGHHSTPENDEDKKRLERIRVDIQEEAQRILDLLAAIDHTPIGPLAFRGSVSLCEKADALLDELHDIVRPHEDSFAQSATDSAGEDASLRAPSRNPFREERVAALELSREVRRARRQLESAEALGEATTLIVTGEAGSGKTHLLCDVARRRLAAGQPTVLLMGQQFVSHQPPWIQALDHLDLQHFSMEEFVGALECAAQIADSRALVMIDAMNEGAGRTIWLPHLAAFLKKVHRSPWISIVLAVRSSYESLVIPDTIQNTSPSVCHHGFEGAEYNATRTFFEYYGLELPSTPLLAPEFRNPLFLKALCSGLQAKGETRVPRGSHGISATFDLHLDGVNARLAQSMGFDPRARLVHQALELVAMLLNAARARWIDAQAAAAKVNRLLPNRDYDKSLYRALVSEGLLTEEISWAESKHEEVVFVAYERLADHLVCRALLDEHLDLDEPDAAFRQGGPLAYLADKEAAVTPGFLEAMCIQIAERTGTELAAIAPGVEGRWSFKDSFRRSLVWRRLDAFSDETRVVLNTCLETKSDVHDTIDTLLTVATIPNHPFNAEFLNERLRKDEMAERDSWWSVHLHRAWGNRTALDRLVDWAWNIDPNLPGNEALDLCATALAWTLTSSNRFLRDRATKALVALLHGRLASAERLVRKFADVNDPYVVERVYAVAYGVAMRSADQVAVTVLAQSVFETVFADRVPPPHILLRDYARGVVERAVHLGGKIDGKLDRIRPPYGSTWPHIPTENEVASLQPNWSQGGHDSGDVEWSRNRIGSSVMSDDFARYVLGTNSSRGARKWLSIPLGVQAWTPPRRREEELAELVADLSTSERHAWDSHAAASAEYSRRMQEVFSKKIAALQDAGEFVGVESLISDLDTDTEATAADERARATRAALESALTEAHRDRLVSIEERDDDAFDRRGPRFELDQVQRYILWRVFDLGWTIARFGHFDRFDIGYHGRDASKAERIGKKYQWIAYHEILAYIADNFQYREEFSDSDAAQVYEGPWQCSVRDIDPSCPLRALPGESDWRGHERNWWADATYEDWREVDSSPLSWVTKIEDLPEIPKMLVVQDPRDGSEWINARGSFHWRQPTPPDRDPSSVERREIWYHAFGYLVEAKDSDAFMEWAESEDFDGRWMPERHDIHHIFLGEFGWSPAAKHLRETDYPEEPWTDPGRDCPAKVGVPVVGYMCESSGVDCSIDEGYTLNLPAHRIATGMGAHWSGVGADFVSSQGEVVAQDPAAHAPGPEAMLFRRQYIEEYMREHGLVMCWYVQGEKRVLSAEFGRGNRLPILRLSGAYVYKEGHVAGFLKCTVDMLGAPDEEKGPIKILRAPG